MTPEITETARQVVKLIPDLTDGDIEHCIVRLNLEREERHQQKKKEAEDAIKELAKKAGLSVTLNDADKFAKKKTGPQKGKKSKIKYRHPTEIDPETGKLFQWAGRGLKPKWIKDLIAQGEDLNSYLAEDFKIPAAEH